MKNFKTVLEILVGWDDGCVAQILYSNHGTIQCSLNAKLFSTNFFEIIFLNKQLKGLEIKYKIRIA